MTAPRRGGNAKVAELEAERDRLLARVAQLEAVPVAAPPPVPLEQRAEPEVVAALHAASEERNELELRLAAELRATMAFRRALETIADGEPAAIDVAHRALGRPELMTREEALEDDRRIAGDRVERFG